MTAWRHAISWSKLKLAIDCPRALQNTIEKKPHAKMGGIGFYQAAGTLAQLTLELYFNQKINLMPGGRSEAALTRATDKVFASKRFLDMTISYPHNTSEDDLKERTKEQVLQGYRTMEKMGMTQLEFRSEVAWRSHFRGIPLFAMIDFIREGASGVHLFDGKGHKEKNADPRQIKYYALTVAASGRTIKTAGFIYWYHGFEAVDCSPKALKEFADTELEAARPTIQLLRQGTNELLEARPEKTRCTLCNWRNNCDASLAANPPAQPDLPETTGFRTTDPGV